LAQRGDEVIQLNLKGGLAVLLLALIGSLIAWLFYRERVHANIGRYPEFLAEDIAIFFIIGVPLAWLVVKAALVLKFKLKTDRVET
jgi:hypothetical protein